MEEFRRVLDRHFENFVNVPSFVTDFERLAVVAFAPANVARHVDVRQEVHFHLDNAVALTGLASTSFDIEAESPWHIAA